MRPKIIAREQKKDTHLKEVLKKSDKFSERTVEISTVITYDNKIYMPISLRKRIVCWYHIYLHHPGITGIEDIIGQDLTCPNLKKDVEASVKNCHECQIGKKVRKKYGNLPERLAEIPIAWNRFDVDLIGPLTIKIPSVNKELLAFTIIEPSTGWFEVKDVKDKSAKESINTFDDVWLSRYPRPEYIGFDNAGELFKEEQVNNYGIKKKNITPFNPQSNGIIKSVHLTLNDSLRASEIDGREMDEKYPWGPFLSSDAYAIRSTFHTTIKATPV
jgi:hypothetical protein